MLSEHENRINLACLKFFALLSIIPIEFQGIMIKPSSVGKRFLWIVVLAAEIGRLVLNIGLTVSKIRAQGLQSFPTLALDYCFIAPPALAIFAAVQSFLKYPGVSTALWSNVVPDSELFKQQDRNGVLWGYTYLEVYTIFLAFSFYPAGIAVFIAYAYIYAFPFTEGLHVGLRWTFTMLEAVMFLSWASWLHFTEVVQITFMEKLSLALKINNANIRDLATDDGEALEKINKSINAVKELQIEVNAFNHSQRYTIFGIKVVLLGCSIFCGFAAVQFFQDHNLLGICNVLVVTEATFAFLFCYDKGFSVPRAVAKLKKSMTLRLRQSGSVTDTQRAYLLRQVASLRKMAIQIGYFHYLQRVSTPNFIDFCAKNVVRLVVFYRKYLLTR